MRRRLLAAIIACAALVSVFSVPARAREKNAVKEEGEFRILVEGKEVGTEKYVLLVAADSASSSSVLDFRNPADMRQRVQLESKLEMDGRFRPRDYNLRSDVDGKKGSIAGSFSPNTVIFEYASDGNPKKRGVMVGIDYTILDTNIFHHFVFLARLFKFDGKEKTQRFEVVIPQEADSGVVKISALNKENILIGGKKTSTRQLQLDSGSLVINLWIDSQRILRKIAVPSLKIEVVRNP